MKKFFFVIFLLFITISSCMKKDSNTYLESALFNYYKNDSQKGFENLKKSLKEPNRQAYEIMYQYYKHESREELLNRVNKSKGLAELYLGLIYYNEKNFDKATEYFEKAIKQGEMSGYYYYGILLEDNFEYNKAVDNYKKGSKEDELNSKYRLNNIIKHDYDKIEKLANKYKDNSISLKEKKEFGRLLIEDLEDFDSGYNVLKEFIIEDYSPALYAKAKMLESRDKFEESVAIYKKIFNKDKYYLAGIDLAYYEGGKENYDAALDYIREVDKHTNKDLNLYYGYFNEKKGNLEVALEYYKKSAKNLNFMGIYNLAELEYTLGDIQGAKKSYEKLYNDIGLIEAGYELALLHEEEEIAKEKAYSLDSEGAYSSGLNDKSKKIYKNLTKYNYDPAKINLSLYYNSKNDINRDLNLGPAAFSYPVSFYNLGIYFYNNKKEEKAKFWLNLAKENGYELDKELLDYIKKM